MTEMFQDRTVSNYCRTSEMTLFENSVTASQNRRDLCCPLRGRYDMVRQHAVRRLPLCLIKGIYQGKYLKKRLCGSSWIKSKVCVDESRKTEWKSKLRSDCEWP